MNVIRTFFWTPLTPPLILDQALVGLNLSLQTKFQSVTKVGKNVGNPKHRFHLKSFLFDRPALPAPGVWPLLLLTFRLKSSAQLLKSDSEEESDNEHAIWSTTYQIKKAF